MLVPVHAGPLCCSPCQHGHSRVFFGCKVSLRVKRTPSVPAQSQTTHFQANRSPSRHTVHIQTSLWSVLLHKPAFAGEVGSAAEEDGRRVGCVPGYGGIWDDEKRELACFYRCDVGERGWREVDREGGGIDCERQQDERLMMHRDSTYSVKYRSQSLVCCQTGCFVGLHGLYQHRENVPSCAKRCVVKARPGKLSGKVWHMCHFHDHGASGSVGFCDTVVLLSCLTCEPDRCLTAIRGCNGWSLLRVPA